MKVSEFIELLKKEDQDATLCVNYDFGNGLELTSIIEIKLPIHKVVSVVDSRPIDEKPHRTTLTNVLVLE